MTLSQETAGVEGTAADGAPLSGAQLRDLLQLALVPGIGPRTLQVLLQRFGEPAACLAARIDELRQVPGVGAKLAHAVAHADLHLDADRLIQDCRSRAIDILTPHAAGYPRPLLNLPDAPPVLFARGGWQPRDALAVSVVGTRHPTPYGLRQTARIVAALSRRGLTIVSGLARGIDAAAHRAAIEAGGRTIAVLGSGVIDVYPPEHVGLAEEIVACGALLSECPPWSKPKRGMFPQRNRLISALGVAAVVIEAGARSGALITARHAGEQGRDVMALPGPVTSRMSEGCHALIRDGAILIESADQVIDALGPLAESVPTGAAESEVRHPMELQLNEQERLVLNQIHCEPTSIDSICTGSGLAIHRTLSTLSVLERRGLIRQISGQKVVRV